MSDETATPAPVDDGEFGHELLMLWVVGATAIVTLVAAGLVDSAGEAIAGAITFAVLTAVVCLPWPARKGEPSTRNTHEISTGHWQPDEPPAQSVARGRHYPAWGPDSTIAESTADGNTRPVGGGRDGGPIPRPGRAPSSDGWAEPDGATAARSPDW